MKQLIKLTALLAVGVSISACAGEPVIADISQDKVIIQQNGAKEEVALAKANEACAMYKKRAQPLSYRCADGYCIQRLLLYACRE